MKRFLALLLLLGFELGAIAILHRVGSYSWLQVPFNDLGTWMERTTAEDALTALLRLVALALAYWLAGSTVLYILASASRIPTAIRAVEWATLPAVRRTVDRVAALSLVAATVGSPLAPAVATEPPAVVYDVEEGVPLPRIVPIPTREVADVPRYIPTPAGTGSSAASIAAPIVVVAAAANVIGSSYQVVDGDNLWTIAARIVSESIGETPDNASIATYWRLLVSENANGLWSGDPDMIYPGETLVTPAVEQ